MSDSLPNRDVDISRPTVLLLVEELIDVTDDWYVFGTLLRIPPGDLDAIKISYPHEGLQYWKIKMFRLWLRSDPNASWKDVVRALEKVKHISLAANLKRTYLLLLPRSEQEFEAEVRADASVIDQLQKLEASYGVMLSNFESVLENCIHEFSKVKSFLNRVCDSQEFSECGDIDKLIDQLCRGHHIDPFNINMLKSLLEFFPSKTVALAVIIEEYEEKKEIFLKSTTITQFQRAVVERVEPILQKGKVRVIIKITSRRMNNLTLKDVEDIALNGFEDCQKHLVHMHADQGSVIISWVFPKILSAKLEKLAKTNAAVFKKAGIEEVTLGGMIVFPGKEEDVSIKNIYTDYYHRLVEAVSDEHICQSLLTQLSSSALISEEKIAQLSSSKVTGSSFLSTLGLEEEPHLLVPLVSAMSQVEQLKTLAENMSAVMKPKQDADKSPQVKSKERQQFEADNERLTSDKAELLTKLQCCEEALKEVTELSIMREKALAGMMAARERDQLEKEIIQHTSFSAIVSNFEQEQTKTVAKKMLESNQATISKHSSESDVSDPIEVKHKPAWTAILNISRITTPSIYQLPLHYTMNKKNVAKAVVGKHSPTPSMLTAVPHKVLMLVGATGAGKSTLINAMANYIMGVDWEDEYRFKLIHEETAHNQSESQTKCITAYTFYKDKNSSLPYTLTVIDTPGLGGTGGLERDKEIIKQIIKEFFSTPGDEGIDWLHGIGFVTQAPLARLTPTQRYVFHSILSVFGKDVADNIFLMVTFADGMRPPVLDAARDAGVPFSSHFKFNNSALFASNKTDNEFDKMFWRMGTNSLKVFFNCFSITQPHSIQLSKEVLRERERLEITIQGLQPQIQAGLAKIDELRQNIRILKSREADIISNKDFTYQVKVTKQRKIDLPRGQYTTNCLNCNYTCHYPCPYANDGDNYRCLAMNNYGSQYATCAVCPGKCSWREHFNNPYRFELYQETETQTSDDLKARYKSALTSKMESEAVTKKAEKELEELSALVLQTIGQARQSLQRLQEIALRPGPALTEVEYIDTLIESEKQEARPGWRQRVSALQEVRKKAKILSTIAQQEEGKNLFF